MYSKIEAKSLLRFVEVSSYCYRCHSLHIASLTIPEAEKFLQELQEAIDDAKHKAKLLDGLAQKPKK